MIVVVVVVVVVVVGVVIVVVVVVVEMAVTMGDTKSTTKKSKLFEPTLNKSRDLRLISCHPCDCRLNHNHDINHTITTSTTLPPQQQRLRL
jgi:hypothetical protein